MRRASSTSRLTADDVTQEDERVGAGTRADDMAMVVNVAGRGQSRDITAVHGALIHKAQFGPATLMANCVPPPATSESAQPNL